MAMWSAAKSHDELVGQAQNILFQAYASPDREKYAPAKDSDEREIDLSSGRRSTTRASGWFFHPLSTNSLVKSA